MHLLLVMLLVMLLFGHYCTVVFSDELCSAARIEGLIVTTTEK